MILSEHTQRAIRHKIRAAGHLIAAEYDCELSDVLDTPATHAPGVQTDGAEGFSSSLPTEPSVDLSGLAAHEQGPTPSPSPMANAPEPESRSTRSRQPGSGDFLGEQP
jgi:hypothetical protein